MWVEGQTAGARLGLPVGGRAQLSQGDRHRTAQVDQRHGLHVDADDGAGARGLHGSNKRRDRGLSLSAIYDVSDRHDARLAQVAAHPLCLLAGHRRNQPKRQFSLILGNGRQHLQDGGGGGYTGCRHKEVVAIAVQGHACGLGLAQDPEEVGRQGGRHGRILPWFKMFGGPPPRNRSSVSSRP